MLKPVPWANTLALVSALFYLVLWLLSVVSPAFFRTFYNAQFLGADVASLYPGTQDVGSLVVGLVLVGVSGWVFGYVWALVYNKLAKKG